MFRFESLSFGAKVRPNLAMAASDRIMYVARKSYSPRMTCTITFSPSQGDCYRDGGREDALFLRCRCLGIFDVGLVGGCFGGSWVEQIEWRSAGYGKCVFANECSVSSFVVDQVYIFMRAWCVSVLLRERSQHLALH